MASLNRIQIIGRLGKDPEVKQTPSGKSVGNFSVATQEKKDGPTEWHSVVVWDKLADLAGQYLHKGLLVYLEGKIQTRSWEQDGAKRYRTEVVAYQMQFLDKKEKQSNDGYQAETGVPPLDESQAPVEDNLPF